ncbi:hypothetical protein SNEBB_008440 [Seison nebaliae]|nr:hypothetical protein SNEBB_008440 [Seison nebaliae]
MENEMESGKTISNKSVEEKNIEIEKIKDGNSLEETTNELENDNSKEEKIEYLIEENNDNICRIHLSIIKEKEGEIEEFLPLIFDGNSIRYLEDKCHISTQAYLGVFSKASSQVITNISPICLLIEEFHYLMENQHKWNIQLYSINSFDTTDLQIQSQLEIERGKMNNLTNWLNRRIADDFHQRKNSKQLNDSIEHPSQITQANYSVLFRYLTNQELCRNRTNLLFSRPTDETQQCRLATYFHYRNLGNYVTDGMKFGGDYLLYEQSPKFSHSYAIVRCLKRNEMKKLRSNFLSAFGRLATTVHKKFVLSFFDNSHSSDLQLLSITWSGLLSTRHPQSLPSPLTLSN